jgi:hypothetical protein
MLSTSPTCSVNARGVIAMPVAILVGRGSPNRVVWWVGLVHGCTYDWYGKEKAVVVEPTLAVRATCVCDALQCWFHRCAPSWLVEVRPTECFGG